MLDHPYEVISCSWPLPVTVTGRRWVSEPVWSAPLTHLRPQPTWQTLDGERCWTIDWREVFRGGAGCEGQMRSFHVVFRLRMLRGGALRFRCDDGSLIRRGAEVVHADREAHHPQGAEIEVAAGDELEIAQWQLHGGWLWGARFINELPLNPASSYLEAVLLKLRNPNGPPLKMYCHARYPLRTVVAVYSMILNGYAPEHVHIFGQDQWSRQTRAFLGTSLPFARLWTKQEVSDQIAIYGGLELLALAQRHWFVMKSCVNLLCQPHEFCLMDDDILILESMDEALHAFRESDFVFTPDADHESFYLSVWGSILGRTDLPRTSVLNTGLFWLRNKLDPRKMAHTMLAGASGVAADWAWEQGLFAHLFSDSNPHRLPAERYLYPLIDGLPGGMHGYDYARNPCGFASIHFGGPIQKPDDEVIRQICQQILGRSQSRT